MSRLREAMDAVRANPKSATAWVTLGELLREDGQIEKATQSFQRALQLDPTNGTAQRGLAQLLLSGSGGAPAQSAAPAPQPARPATPTPSRPATPTPTPATRERERTAPATPPPPAREERAPRRGGASVYESAAEIRTPPPPVVKPSQGRMIAGVVALFLFPMLCICAVFFALARLI